MSIEDNITGEKLQQDINREAAKILVLSPIKIDKYQYFYKCRNFTFQSKPNKRKKNLHILLQENCGKTHEESS